MARSCGLFGPMGFGAALLIVVTATAGEGPALLSMPYRASEVGMSGGFAPTPQIGSSWMAGGGAAADFNNDGWPDLFLVTGGGSLPPNTPSPDRLYINQGDGTFADEAEAWGLTQIHSGNGVAAADFNNNGYVDVYVTSFGNLEDGAHTAGRNKLYRNNGDGTFTNVAQSAGVASVHPTLAGGFGACWGDYDLDGDLDLYVAVQWASGPQPDVLFRNNGDETFTNVAADAGVLNSTVWSFQPAFADMNGNGWPDLLIAADFKTSRYFRNNGNGTFTNITQASGTGLDANGMGQAIADVNNDGLLDWYVTSIYPTIHAPFDGNMLYINHGHHVYDEVAKDVDVHDGAWGWGAIAVDLDQDGWVELIEVNGRPDPNWSIQPPRLFYNNADDTFTDIAVASGMTHTDQGRGIVRLDADRNGLQDVLVINLGQPWRYYRNETSSPGNWIVLDFDTSGNPLLAPNGFGTRVTVEANGKSYVRYMHGDPSYLATSDLNVHFGLGGATLIDKITVVWPRGYTTTLTNVAVNQYLTVTAPALADVNADGVVNVFDLLVLLSMWGSVDSAHDLHADLDNDGQVNVFDLLLLLANWG